ncbi:STAS domain-containing protein [Methanobrevibacter millerae]|nr:STAS domain-containing protein [Methanobrevibacter millerae]
MKRDIMNISKNYNEKELTLTVEGRIDTITSKELEKEINDEIGNFDSLILDFTDLEYISSAGLRVLIATQKKLKADNIPFVIKNINDTINEIFRMSGFDKILKIE